MPFSHDQNFKNLILDYPHQALEFFAERESSNLVGNVRITPVRQEQLKSRLAHYCLDLTELLNTDRVVPVVIFLRSSDSIPKRLQLGGDYHTYLDFTYISCELARLDAELWLESNNLVARLNLPNMNWPPERKLEIYASAVRGLQEMEPDLDKQVKYLDFIDIYTALDNNEMHEYQERYPQETSKMSGLRERWVSEGMEQGIERGLEQGIEQGERGLLYRLLTRRFGPLDPQTETRLQQASADDLERWADNILEARTLEEVFITH